MSTDGQRREMLLQSVHVLQQVVVVLLLLLLSIAVVAVVGVPV